MSKTKLLGSLSVLALIASMLFGCSGPSAQPSAAVNASEGTSTAVQASSARSQDAAQSVNGTDVYTVYADYDPQPAQPLAMIPGTNASTLVAYFSHATNTVLPDGGPDAVTSASIVLDDDGTVLGNAQRMAQWIAQTTGGDLFAIQTAYTYPHDYDQLVSVGEGQDNDGILPELATSLEDPSQYEYVYLVYPVWHFSMPAPVRSFLAGSDLNGKPIFAFAVNSGSSFGDTIDVITQYCPDSEIFEGVSVRQEQVPDSENEVVSTVRNLMAQTHQDTAPEDTAAGSEETATSMNLSVNGRSFTVTLADNQAAREFEQMVADGPVTIDLSDYNGFEKVGPIGRALTASNAQMTAQPGDLMLYNGSNIVLFYGTNTWSYTPLGSVDDLTGWAEALGSGDATAVFSLQNA